MFCGSRLRAVVGGAPSKQVTGYRLQGTERPFGIFSGRPTTNRLSCSPDFEVYRQDYLQNYSCFFV
jgi:hypothetical protein